MSLALNAHDLFMRLRERPLAQRRALFFATFVVSGALVFSFWTNQMYRNFGIVFHGNAGSPEVPSETAEAASGSAVGGLKGPLEVARESVLLLREDFMKLFSGISSDLEAIKYDADSNLDAKKEPPVVAFEVPAEQQNPPLSFIKAFPENKNLDGKKPPLLVSADTNQNQSNSIVSGSEDSENSELKERMPAEAPAINTEAKKTSRVVSIVMTNLAFIRQAFGDLYEYLTQ